MIRLANKEDIPDILDIYAVAKEFMHKNGNPNQWSGTYPDIETVSEDIRSNQLFVITEDDSDCIRGCFALIGGDDPTYEYIDGQWQSNTAYGTIHRIASDGKKKGIFDECVRFARTKYHHLRIDTHADNMPMQHVIAKNGFAYTGVIYLADGTARKAYEWMADQHDIA